ncbi:MAG: DUF4275 family protein [Planctomycetes bacterium]|nr:DUF4275 family protein [Planctomycetota bacterium]
MLDLASRLHHMGFCVEALERPEAMRRWSDWCRSFCEIVKASEGRYTRRGLHWHAFAEGLVPSISGHAARRQYLQIEPETFFVVPENWSTGFGVRAAGAAMPDLTFLTNDLYVFPESLEWTMVFTHEAGYGPYFTRREWCSVPPG